METTITIEHGAEDLAGIDLHGLVDFVLHKMNLPDTTEVSLTFVTDERIHQLNRDYRGIDRPTDVLSFEMDNVPFEDEQLDEQEVYELGDIVIATDVAARQTKMYGTTMEEEVDLLVTHGLLHLCGYDHIKDEDAQVMEALEDKLLAEWEQVRK